MDGITEFLDPITRRVEDFARSGVPYRDVSIALGGIAIGEAIAAIEKKFTRGWLRLLLLTAGGVTSMYVAGKSSNPRMKMEGAVIGSDLFINAIKEALFNKEEVVETAKASIEAIKSGNYASVLGHVTAATPFPMPASSLRTAAPNPPPVTPPPQPARAPAVEAL